MSGRGLRRGAVAIVTASLTLGLMSLPAGAEPDLATARTQAKTLAVQVDKLEIRTEMATENFNEINDQLQTVVNEMTVAEQEVDAAKAGAKSQDDVAEGRVRALYMAGGSAALYATVLDSGSIGDVLSRVDSVNSLVDSDRVEAQQSWTTVRTAEKARKKLGELALKRTRLQDQADNARTAVESLLAQRTRQLAAATSTVRRLADEYTARKTRLAAESARVRLMDLGVLGDQPAGNPFATAAIAAARSKVGVPYVWGATGPNTFDCSGLTQWSYRASGLNINRTSRQQWYDGVKVELADLRPGDLLFWAYDLSKPATIHHVSMYIGAGRMIEAPRTGVDVREVPIYLDGYIGAIRPGT